MTVRTLNRPNRDNMLAEITRLEGRVRSGGKEGAREALDGCHRMTQDLEFGGGPLTFDINPIIAAINKLKLESKCA